MEGPPTASGSSGIHNLAEKIEIHFADRISPGSFDIGARPVRVSTFRRVRDIEFADRSSSADGSAHQAAHCLAENSRVQ
jgi:hypothetical protein